MCVVLFNCLWLQAIVCQISGCLNETSACLQILNTLSKPSTVVGCFCVVKKIYKYLLCMQVVKDFKLKAGGCHFRWHLSSHPGLSALGEGRR